MSFPKGFLVGAATAAHQVEGDNIHSDYWAQEQMPGSSFLEPSGLACDHYHRYEEDITLLAKAGLNAYRFSIEWARIEPEEGKYDKEALEHYRRVIGFCREKGVEPVVTLHHFTSPLWLIQKGGWEAESTVEDFRRYAAYITKELGSELSYICTINEANMGIQIAAIARRYQLMARQASPAGDEEGRLQIGLNMDKLIESRKQAAIENVKVFGTPSPQVFVSPRTKEGDLLVMRAHLAAKEAIKELFPAMQVGITLSLHDCQALPGGEALAEKEWEEEFRHYLPYIQDDDFLGVQNYTRSQFGPEGQLRVPEGAELTQMEYEFYPKALENVIRRVAEDFHGDLIITENGVAVSDDSRRVAFIEEALQGVEHCVQDVLPVKGYFYWSLLDNFEWQKGYSMTFGLIAVDRATQKRSPKESLSFLGGYAR